MTFKMHILASDEAQYLDADDVKTERTCLSKDGKFMVLWKIGTKYYAEINTYFDENFWQGEDNAFDRSEYIIEVKNSQMKKLKNISKLINLMSQHYTNSMDEICVPVIKKILGRYLELNPNYNNGLQRNKQHNGSVSVND